MMIPRPSSGTTTIHRCPCGHKDLDHTPWDTSLCSMDACPCQQTPGQVAAANPAVEIPTFAAYVPGGVK